MYVWVKMLPQHVTSTCLTCSMYNIMRSNFYVHGHFPSSSGGCGGLRNPFPKFCWQNLLQWGHIAFNSPLCLEKSPAPVWSHFRCSFVDWSLESIWLSFSCSLDSVPVNAQGATGLPIDQLRSPDTTCAGCDTTARHRLGRLFFVQCGFCRQLRWILIWCTMWEKGQNEGLTQQFMNTFSSVSVAWSALHTNTRGRWVFLVTTTRSHFHLAQLACHLCAEFQYCKILQTLQDLIDRRAFLMSTAENCFADFRRLSGMHFWILSEMQR